LKSIAACALMRDWRNIRPPCGSIFLNPAWDPADARTAADLPIAGGVLRQCHSHRGPGASPKDCSRARRAICEATGGCFFYGPFKRDGKHTAISNAVFDTSLRERDAEWACATSPIRDWGEARLALIETVPMPA